MGDFSYIEREVTPEEDRERPRFTSTDVLAQKCITAQRV